MSRSRAFRDLGSTVASILEHHLTVIGQQRPTQTEIACSLAQGLPWRRMKKIIQVHIFRGESQFVAECLDLPVVTQGKTLDELAQNLREAIALQLEGENLADFGLASDPSILASFELEPLAHAET